MKRKAGKPSTKEKRGPKPEILSFKGDWQRAIGKSLRKKKPESGWPK
jgi:hypothetical protein